MVEVLLPFWLYMFAARVLYIRAYLFAALAMLHTYLSLAGDTNGERRKPRNPVNPGYLLPLVDPQVGWLGVYT